MDEISIPSNIAMVLLSKLFSKIINEIDLETFFN